MIRPGEHYHLMEQHVNLLHFDEKLWNDDSKNYKKFARDNKKSTIFHQNGASLHAAPSNDNVPQALSFDGAKSKPAPFSACCDDFSSQQEIIMTFLFHLKME